jgi:hypothetical protein
MTIPAHNRSALVHPQHGQQQAPLSPDLAAISLQRTLRSGNEAGRTDALSDRDRDPVCAPSDVILCVQAEIHMPQSFKAAHGQKTGRYQPKGQTPEPSRDIRQPMPCGRQVILR